MSERILVTGGAGFIGSGFIEYFLKKCPDISIVNLDKLTYAGSLDNLKGVEGNSRYRFVHGDICDRNLVERIFKEHDITGVIHFAAESHVDNSILGPYPFVKTNIEGTFTLLDVARNYWMEKPFVFRKGYDHCRFHHISTDEVFGSLGAEGYFTESSPYAPNSPYSATKAGSDMLVRSYFHTYGLPVVITNCSNNYGPRQHQEKLIPTIIRKALGRQPVPIYGDGKNVRDWLYVGDHCEAIATVFTRGKLGETYNIGGNTERTNIGIARLICRMLDRLRPLPDGSYEQYITFVADRPGHDWRYAIDITKIRTELEWIPRETFETGIEKTVKWYMKKM